MLKSAYVVSKDVFDAIKASSKLLLFNKLFLD